MSEEQKYQGALYKNKKAKTTATDTPSAPKTMAQAAYVKDVVEEYRDYDDYEDDNRSTTDAPPHAPTPPPAGDGPVNVFDFLVANATPNASNTALPQPAPAAEPSQSRQLVRFDYQANSYTDPTGYMVEDSEALVQYGTGPIPAGRNPLETPAPKADRKKKDSDREVKKDKKRKRLHIDTHDQIMTDAPPVLHSGLTGGLNRLMSRPHAFPPSPDASGSGGEVIETPASPLKKSRHSKHSKSSRTEGGIGNNLMAMLTNGGSKKTKKRKAVSTTKTKKHTSHRHRSDGKEQKLIEYRPASKEGDKEADASAMVIYKPRADLLMSFIEKGPDSERGCSMNKALKRFHRERTASGNSLGKLMEEKELWRSLRMRKNDRGEIVLFSI